MTEFTIGRHDITIRGDIPIKNLKSFKKNLEARIKREFEFDNKVVDRASIYNLRIVGIIDGNKKTTIYSPIQYSLSDGPPEIEYNRRIIIEKSVHDVDICKYMVEKYINKLVKMSKKAAEETNKVEDLKEIENHIKELTRKIY